MKNFIRLTALLLTLAGCFTFCTSEMDNKSDSNDEFDMNYQPVADPEEAILGKWELVQIKPGQYGGIVDEKQTPKGYVEYLSEGRFAWYDYDTKEYTLHEGKYLIDKSYGWEKPPAEHKVEDGWVLHYETFRTELDDGRGGIDIYYLSPDFPDKQNGNQFHLHFINKDTISLGCLDLISIVGISDYIYKRKK